MSPRPLAPEDPDLGRALALAREGRLAEAFDALAAAAPARGGRSHGRAGAPAFAELGRIAAAAGDADLALRSVDEALRRAPDYADLHLQRAGLLLQDQQRPAARRALEEALRINPHFAAARLELALLDAREGLLTESLAALRALEQEHRVEEPRAFRRGMRSLARADWDEAGALLRSALRLSDPELERAMDEYRARLERGEPALALHALREVVAAHPGYPDLHLLLGTAELEAGMADDAIASLARALELHPDLHAARVQLARALETQGDLVQAGEQIALVLREVPGHPQALELEERWRRHRIPRAPRGPAARDTAGREAS